MRKQFTRPQKLSYETLEKIMTYSEKGIDTRAVASIAACSESSVQNYRRLIAMIRKEQTISAKCNRAILVEYAIKHKLPTPIFSDEEAEDQPEQIAIEEVQLDDEKWDLKRLIQAIDRLSNTVEVFWRNARANVGV